MWLMNTSQSDLKWWITSIFSPLINKTISLEAVRLSTTLMWRATRIILQSLFQMLTNKLPQSTHPSSPRRDVHESQANLRSNPPHKKRQLLKLYPTITKLKAQSFSKETRQNRVSHQSLVPTQIKMEAGSHHLLDYKSQLLIKPRSSAVQATRPILISPLALHFEISQDLKW